MPKVAVSIGHGSDTFDKGHGKGLYYNDDGERQKFEEHDDFNAHCGVYVIEGLKRHGFDVLVVQEPWGKEVPLATRTYNANKWGADLYWSIHANYNQNEHAAGACAWYWYNAEGSKKLAHNWANNVKDAGIELHGHGTHAADANPSTWEPALWECRKTNMSAVLTENGFFSNPDERARMLTNAFRLKMAEIHVKTICEWFNIDYKPKRQEEPKEAPKNGLYQVQIGAFSKKDNAERMLKAAHDKGFKDAFIKFD